MKLSWRMSLFARLLPTVWKPVSEMSVDELREAQRRGVPRTPITARVLGRPHPDVRRVDRRIPTRDGDVAARVYLPPRARAGTPCPLVLYFHGGGWARGSLDQGDWLCSTVSVGAGTVVVSVDYRLAPDHRFPAAVTDCYDATRWVAGHHGELRGRPGPLAVMGDSAGGNLATVTSMIARDEGGPAIAAQALIYPSTDVTMSSPSVAVHANAPILTRRDMAASVAHYTGGEADPAHPHLSPLLTGDLVALPPAAVLTAEHDPLKDEGRAYADRLRDAGVPVRFTEYVGVPHGFVSFPGLTRAAHQAVSEITTFLDVALAGMPERPSHAPASA